MCDAPIDGGAMCGDAGPAPDPTSSPACNQCIDGCCGAEWCACAGDSPVDDAGVGGCVGYVGCMQACLFPAADAGVDAGTLSTCSMQCGQAYTMPQVNEGNALLQCAGMNCANGTDNSCAGM